MGSAGNVISQHTDTCALHPQIIIFPKDKDTMTLQQISREDETSRGAQKTS